MTHEVQPTGADAVNAKAKRRWYQYSLRTLLLVVTVVGLVLGRIEYLRRKAAYHSGEARKHFATFRQRTRLSEDEARRDIAYARHDDADARGALHHLELAEQFEFARYYPWVLVSEIQRDGFPLNYDDLYYRHLYSEPASDAADELQGTDPLEIPQTWTDLENIMKSP